MAMRKSGFVKYAHVAQVEVLPTVQAQAVFDNAPQTLLAHLPVLLDPEKFLYTRERAISAYERHGLNGNYDGWVEPELKRSYQSFIHVPRYVDHDNTNPERAVGIVLDAVYHPLDDSESSGWVETISARDKSKMAEIILYNLAGQPTLLEAVQDRVVTDVSMGCFVDESVCTVCGNKARDEAEYCQHVATQKGQELKISSQSPLVSMGYKPGHKVRVGELNYGVTFFELSDITTQANLGGGGADLDAKILERLASKSPSGWEQLLVHRTMGSASAGRQMHGQSQGVVLHNTHSSQGVTMKKGDTKTTAAPKKEGGDWSGPELDQVVVKDDDKITQETESKDYGDKQGQEDKDQALFDESQVASPQDLKQKVLPSDENISQQSSAPDYPHPDKMGGQKKSDFIPTSSDPANTVGGKPEEVQKGEDVEREQSFEQVEPKLDPGAAADAEQSMHEDMEEERQDMETKMQAALTFVPVAEQSSERVAQKRDAFDGYLEEAQTLRKKALTVRSQELKTQLTNKADGLMGKAQACLKEILAYGTEPTGGGNQQALVDIPNMEQGDPDANLLDQSQGQSQPSGAQHMIEKPENAAQVERPDHPHKGDGKTSALKPIYAGNADSAVMEMAERMMAGEDFETVQSEVFDSYGEPQQGLANRAEKTAGVQPPEVLSFKQVARICPPCAFRMRRAGMSRVSLKLVSQMLEQAVCAGFKGWPVKARVAYWKSLGGNAPAVVRALKGYVADPATFEWVLRKSTADTDPATGNEYTNVEDDTRPTPKAAPESGKTTDLTTLKTKGQQVTTAQEHEEELNDTAGETKTDLSEDIAEDSSNDSLLGRGTTRTKAGPMTREITDPTELIQLSGRRQALAERIRSKRGQDDTDVGTRFDQGTDLTKASPTTKEISKDENEFQAQETESLTRGQSAEPVPPILSGNQLLAQGVIRYRQKIASITADYGKKIRLLREQNERYRRRAEGVCRAWKWDQCRATAMSMLRKGFFIEDKNGKQRPFPEQKRAAYNRARELMRLSNAEIERQMEIVSEAQEPGTLVPEWKKPVHLPHPDAVKRAAHVPSHVTRPSDGELGENIFIENPERGF